MINHSISLIGQRPSNEDHHFIYENINGDNLEGADINLYCIFDGHGGKGVSKFLKEKYPPCFINKDLLYNPTKKTEYYKFIKKISYVIQEKIITSVPSAKNSGSTALTVLFYNNNNKKYYYIINIGDSRAIICNKYNIAVQLTKDHKPSSFEEKQRITQLGGKIVYDEGDWRIKDLSVSRAFGDLDSLPYITSQPDIFRYELLSNDKFMIIACDGLWDIMSNQEVVEFILEELNKLSNKNKTTNGNGKNNIAKLLGEYAIQKGSYDNITIIIVFF